MTTSVAPNADNTLTVPVRRLPLGVPIPTDVGPTRWKVWIPNAYGGLLTVTHSGATQLDIQQPLGTSLGTGTTEAKTVVKLGECFVIVAGDSGMLSATLFQKIWARADDGDPSSAPLLPYNFYFWPVGRGSPKAVLARNVLARYAAAVGKDAAQADSWEVTNHQKDVVDDYEGHCHNAAPASALFEQPQAQTINGQAFTEEEMEFLATEWYGNFDKDEEIVWLDSDDTKPVKWDVLAYLKPGGPKDCQAFISGLTSALNNNASLAVEKADGWVKGAGSEAEFTKQRKEGFGKNAAKFFKWIQQHLVLNGAPIVSNMRPYDGNLGPEQVWNQVYFYMEATFAETWPSSPQDDHDIKVSCNLYSNIDDDPSPGLPGTVANNEVTPGTSSHDCWLYKHVYRIVFDDQGHPSSGDPRNEWVSVQNDKGEELYAPVYLSTIAKPSATPLAPPPFPGNPALGVEFLSYVKIQPRFK